MNTEETNIYKMRVRLYPNNFTTENGKYYARTAALNVMNTADLCKEAYARGGSSIKPADMQQAVEAFFKEMAYKLENGSAINTGYFCAYPTIKGSFKSKKDTFDKDRHTILFKFTQGHKMRKKIENVDFRIEGYGENEALIQYVYDYTTKEENEVITPNRNVRLDGNKIRITGDDETVGLYLVNSETNERTKVPEELILENTARKVLFLCPDLTPGMYTIEIFTQQMYGKSMVRNVSVVKYDGFLQVG